MSMTAHSTRENLQLAGLLVLIAAIPIVILTAGFGFFALNECTGINEFWP